MVIIENDTFFLRKFSNIGQGFKIPQSIIANIKGESEIFFNNKIFIKHCSTILLNYLLKKDSIIGMDLNNQKSQEYIAILINQLFQVEREPFVLSLENIDH